MMKHGIMVALTVAIGAWVAPATGQSCPTEYSSCDNGGCCLSAEQCCPRMEDGCCSSATPYCCGNGTCAATPSQCELNGRSECDGYDVPCGGGCAPAGSHCCDLVGHYCPPESMCTSDTSCVFGDMVRLALEVAVVSVPEGVATPGLSPPFEDPPDATERSCGLATPTLGRPGHPWLLLLAAAVLSLRRRLHGQARGFVARR